MDFLSVIGRLADEIISVEEETFALFAQDLPSQDLGFVDSKASVLELELSLCGRDLTIHQSPGVLTSNRAGGTTGAVVWKITPLFAEWISAPDNPLFAGHVLSPQASVLELGCGISALVGLSLEPRVARFVMTDQKYVEKLVDQNIAQNPMPNSTSSKRQVERGRKAPRKGPAAVPRRVYFTPLDWETDQVTPALTGSNHVRSFDLVIACDCIYNEALVEPFVKTCVDVCRLRSLDHGSAEEDRTDVDSQSRPPCVCLVAQQLRSPEVFELWLGRFSESFRVWRVPDSVLTDALHSKSGFAVHVGILKEA